MQKIHKPHTHPALERAHNIPPGHVIIDEVFFVEAWRKYWNEPKYKPMTFLEKLKFLFNKNKAL